MTEALSPDEVRALLAEGAEARREVDERLARMERTSAVFPPAPVPAEAREAGRKDDNGKPRIASLVPWPAFLEVVAVLEYGARKYTTATSDGAWNWHRFGAEAGRPRYLDALMRHAIAYARGETHDPETGLHHLAHLVACALFIVTFDLEKTK